MCKWAIPTHETMHVYFHWNSCDKWRVEELFTIRVERCEFVHRKLVRVDFELHATILEECCTGLLTYKHGWEITAECTVFP